MKVILLEKIHNLGNLGDTVNVKEGHARNFLLKQKKAVRATEENLAEFENKRAELEKVAAEQLKEAKLRAKKLEGIELVVKANAMDEGKLYGSVGVGEIVDILKLKNIDVAKREINLLNGPAHMIGEMDIEIVFHSDVRVPLKVKIEPEK